MENILEHNQFVKTPLEYQVTEYDCGTATIINALRYLFYRSEISPEILKFIRHFTLDNMSDSGEVCKGGTSELGIHFICDWLNINAPKKGMNLNCIFLKQKNYTIDNEILKKIVNNGGVAILRVYQSDEHYCLLTKIDDEYAYLFDPYYFNDNFQNKDNSLEFIKDKPFAYNVKVLKSRINENSYNDYALVKGKNREIVIITRT